MEENKFIVKENMICPVSKQHCSDECCTVGSECNISGSDIVDVEDEELNAVLKCAVNAIYFNDNADYLRTLYTIVNYITEKKGLLNNINELFRKLNKEDLL